MNIVTQNINLHTGSKEEKRATIQSYFNETFTLYERLFDCLIDDGTFYLRPQPLRHPLIFYFGHTAVFFVNKLTLAGVFQGRINSRFESLFAIGVDEMSWDDLNEAHYDWPEVSQVRAYRDAVRAAVNALIEQLDFALPIGVDSPMWPVIMGIEHERIHLETSSVLIRQLELSRVRPSPLFVTCPDLNGAAPENELIPVAGGSGHLGKDESHFLYGWDNEYGDEPFDIPDFLAAKTLVSNAGFLAFVKDGGYDDDRWWDEEGLGWRNYHRAQRPEFWVCGEDGALRLRLMTHEVPLPLDWPAEVCCLEAQAWCRWMSHRTGQPVRLPDEAEYRLLLRAAGREREHCDDPIAANWNLEHFASPVPVTRFVHGPFCDVVGNVWQWNATPIYAFNGFRVHPLYDDFSVPTFDNRHNLIKGGSFFSTGNEIALHSRYAFRRHFYQHAGFRYVVSHRPVKTEFDVYETDPLVTRYCQAHYGDPEAGAVRFTATIAAIACEATDGAPRGRALDIGCSVGGIAFALSPHFAQVDALDFTARNIGIARRMQENRRLRWERIVEGDLRDYVECAADAIGLPEGRNILFAQQDACNLKPRFTDYDLVVAANLIEELYDPGLFLREIGNRMKPGAVLIIASTNNWRAAVTPVEKWVGGVRRDGDPVLTVDGLREILVDFTLIGPPRSVPSIVRETAWRSVHSLSQVTLWRRRQ